MYKFNFIRQYFLISEVTDALSGMNGYIEIVMDKVQSINIDNWNINSNIKPIIENATVSFINEARKYY